MNTRQRNNVVILLVEMQSQLKLDVRVTLTNTDASATPAGERTISVHSPECDNWTASICNVVLKHASISPFCNQIRKKKNKKDS